MKLTLDIVNAFTQTQFKGNPAAVVVTDTPLDKTLMQNIASQNNLSETAFLSLPSNADTPFDYQIRWFSPVCEINFCGHASLASASVIFKAKPDLQTITFFADAVGVFQIERLSDGRLEMMFPNRMPEPVAVIPEAILTGLSQKPVEVLKNDQAYFAVFEHASQIHQITQNPNIIASLAPLDVVITAPGEANALSEANVSEDSADFVSRYFWPANGSDEDPVTGSIHTGLAPYWARRLNKTTLKAYQASARGGRLECRVTPEKVYICGAVVPYLTGTINV